MKTFKKTSDLTVSADDLFAWHARPGAFERLTPPWERVTVTERRGGIEPGGVLIMRLAKGPLRLTWEAHHRDTIAGRQFVDEQVRGPFASWVHTHRFEPTAAGGSRLVDHIDYAVPLGLLGRLVAGRSVARSIARMFDYRHRQTGDDMSRHAQHASRPRLRVAISGASGLVGTALDAFLTTGGHTVLRLVRRPTAAPGEVRWDPAAQTIDAAALEGVDAVVHLAGAGVADKRWTDDRKAVIRDSRVDGTRLLAETLAGLDEPPRVLVSASAIGYYGDRGDATLTEDAAPGEGFLADVTRAWEAATAPAAAAGIRVVNPRIGVVLSPNGGALDKLLTPFRLGVGGRIGSGAQWMSWIALDDLVGLIHHLLYADEVSGPVNAVAPNPVTNREFTRTLGAVLRRPTFMAVPRAAITLAFGEMGRETILASARVSATRATDSGYAFAHPELEGALRHVLGR